MNSKELICVELNPAPGILLQLVLGWFSRDSVPTSLLTLAALTPRDYRVTMLTGKIFLDRKDFVPGALVAITCYTSNCRRSYEVADKYRSAGSKVVMGGAHVSHLPEEALSHCDSVVIGEAESVWAEVIRDHERGELKKIYRGQPLDDFFTPVYDYYQQLPPRVLRGALIFTRGCRFACDFCANVITRLRQVQIDQAIKIITCAKPGFFDVLNFADDNIYANPEWAKGFFRRLAPLEVSWCGHATIDIANDPEALDLLKKSGCRVIQVGIETMNFQAYPKVRAGKIATFGGLVRAIRRIRAAGVAVVVSFVIGLDHDTHSSYFRLLLFLLAAPFCCPLRAVSMFVLVPIPGSAMHEKLEKEGRLLSRDWSRYFLPWHMVYRPKNMSRTATLAWFWVLRLVSIFFSGMGLSILAMIFGLCFLFYFLGQGGRLQSFRFPAFF